MTSELEIEFSTNENLLIPNSYQYEKLIRKLSDFLTKGDLESSLKLYKGYIMKFPSEEFSENIFKPTIEKIRKDFDSKQIGNADYHVAKNLSIVLAKIISKA
jgi:hypothetical protein